jgi:hypothetical protein
MLAVVGGLQVWLLKRQEKILHGAWKEIHTQARHMSRQADLMRRNNVITLATAQAAHKSADATEAQIQLMKSKEQARLVIRRVETPEIGSPERILDSLRPLWVRFFVENVGHSKAFSVRVSGMVDIVSNPEKGVHGDGFLQNFPQIIDEGDGGQRFSLGGFGREFEDIGSTGDFLSIPEEMAQQLRNGEIFIQASGLLTYVDIFGDGHRTPFRLIWKSMGDDNGGMWLTRSAWVDYSPVST